MERAPRILLVDDDHAVIRGVSGLLRDEGYLIEEAHSAGEAFTRLQNAKDPPAMMLLDLRMPDETGLQLLARLPKPLPLPVVVLSGQASASDAVEALKLGATDFVEKPPSAERLLTAIRNALALTELREERERLRDELKRPGSLVGDSAAMDSLRETIARVAPSDAVILITGETGSGKERVARALHLASGRKGRFVAVNCAAIPAQLLESELFGHERGAFTGAVARRLGRIEQAQSGTLLLDEIGDMPLELQSKLLRVLEQREVERLGGNGSIPISVRFIAATHQDLAKGVDSGRFRQDLFYRLNVFPVGVPPLRARPDDIVPLAHAFVADLLGPGTQLELTPAAIAVLRAYRWPGNVRELRNVIERLVLLRGEGALRVDAPQLAGLAGAAPTVTSTVAAQLGDKGYREWVEDFERDLLRRALEQSDHNVAAAARLLRLDRGNLYRRMQTLGIKDAKS